MSKAPGTKIGPFTIQSLLGRGGMGEVFLAIDERLNRKVALKVLAPELTDDPERGRRFDLEARTLASLNHPNVLTIFEAGVHDGARYLASELLQGQTLREQLQPGPLPPGTAVDYARQISRGLAAAHQNGIVHRDLKPENIFICRGGPLKILDFGLSKWRPKQAEETPPPDSRTVIEETEPGMMLGTPSYMSPEQVRGQSADHRADLFALGAIFYEMLAGKKLFGRPTGAEIMAAILRDDFVPDHSIPGSLIRILQRCLEKEPDRRFQSATDLHFALEEIDLNQVEARPADPSVAVSQLSRALRANPSGTDSSPFKSVAVLPFANMSAERENEYLSDGITEDLLSALAKVPGLRVPARTSSFAFKGKNEDVRRIGELLNVDTVLEGSVRRAGNRLRITATLIDVANGYQLWSEKFDREMKDVFDIQDEISQGIAVKLKGTLATPTPRPHGWQQTGLEVYELCLKARYHLERLTEENLKIALPLFQEAVEKQPDSALAYSGLASTYISQGFFAYERPADVFPLAKAAAERALEIDPNLPDAHQAAAECHLFYDRDWTSAERRFQRALELKPSNPETLRNYAFLLAILHRHSESIHLAEQSRQFDPYSLRTRSAQAWTLWFAREYSRALQIAEELIALEPSFYDGFHIKGYCLWSMGQFEPALRELETGLRLAAVPHLFAKLARCLANLGRVAEAEGYVRRFEQLRNGKYTSPYPRAMFYLGSGQNDQANLWINQCIEDHIGTIVYLEVAADDWTRRNPHYHEWLRKLNLAK